MVSHHLLSKEEFQYLSSQKVKKTNLSQHRKRIAVKVGKMFNTLSLVLDSKNLDQEFKDTMFNPTRVSILINSLTQHNPQNHIADEVNKQTIILHMIEQVLDYYRSRYKDDKIIIKEITEFQDLAQHLQERANTEKEDNEATMMYKIRGKMPYPPYVERQKYYHTALCKQCFAYSLLGKTKNEAIKNIRHAKYCSFKIEWKRLGKIDKERVITQFFETQKPIKKS